MTSALFSTFALALGRALACSSADVHAQGCTSACVPLTDLRDDLRAIVQLGRERYPNLEVAFLWPSPRWSLRYDPRPPPIRT